MSQSSSLICQTHTHTHTVTLCLSYPTMGTRRPKHNTCHLGRDSTDTLKRAPYTHLRKELTCHSGHQTTAQLVSKHPATLSTSGYLTHTHTHTPLEEHHLVCVSVLSALLSTWVAPPTEPPPPSGSANPATALMPRLAPAGSFWPCAHRRVLFKTTLCHSNTVF